MRTTQIMGGSGIGKGGFIRESGAESPPLRSTGKTPVGCLGSIPPELAGNILQIILQLETVSIAEPLQNRQHAQNP